MRLAHALLAAGVVAAILAGCKKPRSDEGAKTDAAAALSSTVAATAKEGDPARGQALLATFECNRCHTGASMAAPTLEKDCVGCHRQIMDGSFHLPPEPTWKPRVAMLAITPSLDRVSLFTRASIEEYLLAPHHLRPSLVPSMPRLEMTRDQARDIAAYLAPAASSDGSDPLAGADLAHGRAVLDTKGCGTCHEMNGVERIARSPMPVGVSLPPHAIELAPDLRFARERLTPKSTMAWLSGSMAGKPGILMPKIPLSDDETRDVTAYILRAKLVAPPTPQPFARLPVLTRKVTFEEVDKKVFHRTCWHCHSEPDYAIGDGGPGNSGGLGFAPRGVNLSDYNGIAAGMLDAHGARQSIFAPVVVPPAASPAGGEGVPRLVAALVARHVEENGGEVPGIRGMPLGYRALPAEDIRLVESWIAQGRPR